MFLVDNMIYINTPSVAVSRNLEELINIHCCEAGDHFGD